MVGKVEVDPALLAQAQLKTEQVQNRLRSVISTLVAASDGKGDPWGDDRLGNQFAGAEGGNAYLGARSNLHKLSETLTQSVGNNAEGQGKANTTLTDADEGSARALH